MTIKKLDDDPSCWTSLPSSKDRRPDESIDAWIARLGLPAEARS